MSTKYFEWGGNVTVANPGDRYSDGNPVEWQFSGLPTLAVQGWHNVPKGTRTAITLRLTAAGWIEGEQSKPD
jgi:hypothetical protein